MRRWPQAAFLVVCLFFLLAPVSLAAEQKLDERDDGFFELFDETGRKLTMTARNLVAGDGYIASDNRYYVIERVEGDKVYARYKETIKVPEVDGSYDESSKGSSVISWLRARAGRFAVRLAQRWQNDDGKAAVAIYVTHSDESYIPTSGTASEERGDVYDVAQALGGYFEELGYKAVVSQASHLPRDGEAYLRSRRTAAELLRRHRPATLIDVHRDAVPADIYETKIHGQDMVKVRLVVGRQNQNRGANLEYAKRIKAIADRRYPGLIEGIFNARGNYNQDLSPRAILLEFGTHVTSESKAKTAARLMARVLPAAAGLGTARGETPPPSDIAGAAARSLWWILGIAAAVAVGLVLVNGEQLKHLKGFFSKEFANSAGVSADETQDEEGGGEKQEQEPDNHSQT